MLNELGIKLILIFSIGLVVSCAKSPEANGSLKTLEGIQSEIIFLEMVL